MASRASTLIVPVENQIRELDAKLLLACVAAERGFPVVLGSRAFVHHQITSFSRGVYMAKSMRSLSDRMFSILRKLGHEIVAWDEESLVRAPDQQYWDRRLSFNTVPKVSALFAWGPDDARVFRSYPGYTGAPIHVTGNPRVDMLRSDLRSYYDEDVAEIRRRFGRFVLINTNFGWSNHFVPNFVQKNNNGKKLDDFMTRLVAHRSELFEYFKEMVPALSKALPDLTLLVRPHPTEKPGPWNQLAREYDNVEVVNEGNVIPWLMACETLVHNSCTTAIEAFILGTPAIAYQPVRLEAFDDELPNSLSSQAVGNEELAQLIRSIVAGSLERAGDADRQRLLARHVSALDGPLAAERMVDVLEQAGYREEPPARPSSAGFVEAWLHAQARTAVKKINMRRSKHRNSLSFHARIFPDISLDQIRGKIDRLASQLGRFENVRVRQHSKHIFHIDQ